MDAAQKRPADVKMVTSKALAEKLRSNRITISRVELWAFVKLVCFHVFLRRRLARIAVQGLMDGKDTDVNIPGSWLLRMGLLSGFHGS